MTAEQKLRMRVQELEDLVTEMKQQAGPAKVVELQSQIQAQNLDLARIQLKNKELLQGLKDAQERQKPVAVNSQDAVDYYSQLLREKEEEIVQLRKGQVAEGFVAVSKDTR